MQLLKLSSEETFYHYEVEIFTTTFGKDENRTPSFTHTEKFKSDDLSKDRSDAMDYYMEKLNGINSAKDVLPFGSPATFIIGQNSAISIELNLVESYGDSITINSLSDPNEIEETLKLKRYIFFGEWD